MKRSFLSALAVCTALIGVTPAFAQQPQPQSEKKDQQLALPQTHTYAVLPSAGPRLQNPMPSSSEGVPQKPASNEEIALTGSAVERQINAIAQGASDRIKNIKVGSGDMNIEATPDTTLRAILNHEAKMRNLSMLQGEVPASLGLWGTSYAGPREDVKKDSATPTIAPAPLQPAVPVVTRKSPEDRLAEERQQKAEAKEEAQEAADAKNQAIADDIAGRKRALGQIPPVVSSIYGSPRHPKAFILVPYMGSLEVTHDGQTFNLIDGSVMKITNISVDGVYASHSGRKPKMLGFGSAVPTEADAVAMFNAISAPEAASAQRSEEAQENPAPPSDGPPGGGTAVGITATKGVPIPQ